MLVIQKIIGAFVDFPGVIITGLLFAGLRAQVCKKPKGGYFVLAFLFYLLSTEWVFSLLPFPSLAPPSLHSEEAIVVLGGGVERNPETLELSLSPVSLARVYRAFLLYREKQLPILVSGGKLSENQERSEAEVAFEVLTALGVPSKDIILEARSRTTWENARYSTTILKALGIRSFYLVTSRIHLPRALFAFRHWYPEADITPCPAHASLDFTAMLPVERFLPRREVFCAFGSAIHEGVGYLLYLLRSFLPLSE